MLISEIQAVVAHRFGMALHELRSRRQTKEATLPRHVAMWLSRHFTPHTYHEIARQFERDHSTVITAISRLNERMVYDAGLALTVMGLRILLGREFKPEPEPVQLTYGNDNFIKIWELRL